MDLTVQIPDDPASRMSASGGKPYAVSAGTMSPAEAVADIRELRKGVTLGGLRIKDLSGEGRK